MTQDSTVIAIAWPRIPGVAKNWGDKLNPYLIHALSQQPVAHVRDLLGWEERPVHKVIGSGLSSMQPRDVYWGMGFIQANARPKARAREIHAVRGPLTRQRLKELRIACPEVYGDPALLLPLVLSPKVKVTHEFGIIQHFREAEAGLDVPKLRETAEPKIIDINGSIEGVVEDILSCETIVSTSLHGVIAAHAYGRKAYWLKASDIPVGDDFKFYDYWASIGHTDYKPATLGPDGFVELGDSPSQPVPGFLDTEALLRACPFLSKRRLEELLKLRKKMIKQGATGTPFGV